MMRRGMDGIRLFCSTRPVRRAGKENIPLPGYKIKFSRPMRQNVRKTC